MSVCFFKFLFNLFVAFSETFRVGFELIPVNLIMKKFKMAHQRWRTNVAVSAICELPVYEILVEITKFKIADPG